MPLYPVECRSCEHQADVYQSMQERGADVPYPRCSECGGENRRVFTVPNLTNLDTAFFRPWYSDNLSRGADPVFIDSRSTWKRKMAEMGVQPAEPVLNPSQERWKAARDAERRQSEAISRAVDATLALGPQGVTTAVHELRNEAEQE